MRSPRQDNKLPSGLPLKVSECIKKAVGSSRIGGRPANGVGRQALRFAWVELRTGGSLSTWVSSGPLASLEPWIGGNKYWRRAQEPVQAEGRNLNSRDL